METKKWYKSKTMVFNALTIVIVLASFFGFILNQELSEQVAGGLLGLAPIINLLLRFVTKTPIGL